MLSSCVKWKASLIAPHGCVGPIKTGLCDECLTCCFSQLGSTAIGIQTSEGVCLAVEKRITSPLMEPSSIEKIVEIDTHIGN